tara:strand:+ start:7929 stop:9833 length:1905 start_codon:yes stop_codon:yes gene_type:complete
MGAYDNPTILRDTSLGVYSKAIDTFGKTVAGGIIANQKAREARAASTEKNRIRVQGAQAKIAGLQWKNATDNQGKWKGPKQGELWDKYVSNVKFLLEGDGGKNIGSIKAATEIETNSNLTDEQRSQYRAIINKSNIYQTNAIQNNSYALSDMIDFDGVGQKGMLNTHYWAGDTDVEKDTNMLTAFGLKNLPMKGSSYIRDQKIGDNGESLLFVETTIEKDSEAWQSLSDETKAKLEEDLVKNIATGKMEGKLTFQKDFASLISTDGENITGGLIRQIGTTIDVAKINKESEIVSDGDIESTYVMGGENAQVFITEGVGDSGKSQTTGYKIVSEAAINANDTFTAEVASRAEVMLDNPLQNPSALGDLQAQMQNTLKMGTDNWNLEVPGTDGKIINNFSEFNDLDVPEKEAILVNELKEQYYEETFAKLKKSKYNELPYDMQQFIVNNEGTPPEDLDKIYYFKEQKTIQSTNEDKDLYLEEIATSLMDIELSSSRDKELFEAGGDQEGASEGGWNQSNADKHVNYIRQKLKLQAATGDDAREKVRAMWERKNKEAVKRGEEPVDVNEKVSAVKRRSLWVLNPVKNDWEEQGEGVYDPFDNSSLRSIVTRYKFKTATRKKEFENFSIKQDRADLPN